MFFQGQHKIQNLYDSHVHWMYTGQLACTWNLKDISDPDQILQTKIKPEFMRGEWITGFGWDENKWPKNFRIHKDFLDHLSKNSPILLSRTDGHSSWVNSIALEKLGFHDPQSSSFQEHQDHIVVDEKGMPTGHLKESAHMKALFQLPPADQNLQIKFLLKGAETFNKAGFTHIRDMTSSFEQWSLNRQLLTHPDFLLHTEHWFVCERVDLLSQVLGQLQSCKKDENQWMKVRGVKVFVDGSLGSDTARISSPYPSHNHSGHLLWSEKDVKTVLRETWKNGFEVALHSLGDEATHLVVKWAREVYSEGLQGYLNLEHAEIVRPETIQNMKALHVRCHMQPCHWWGDQKWLREKIGPLFNYAFPWEALRKAQVPVSFGSDAPIEESSLFSNLRALLDSAQNGIKPLSKPALEFHVYPHADSVSGWTLIENDQIKAIGLGEKTKSFT